MKALRGERSTKQNAPISVVLARANHDFFDHLNGVII